ncbi:MAG: ATP-binding protein [Patescibacteria group bacterium]|mgnify:CR=1 FL=1
MKDEENRLNAILSSMAEGLVAIDKDRKVILMNQAAGILLRTAPQEATGRDVRELLVFFRDDKELDYESLPIERAITERNIISVNLLDNLYVRAKNGRLFPVAMMIAPLLTQGEAAGAIILFRDITKEREIDQAKTELVSLASHQLRTPLSAINWYAEMLIGQEVGTLTEKQKEYLENLSAANHRMIELVNSLLNVSRIDLGTFAIDPTPIDFASIGKSVLAELEPQILVKKLVVQVAHDPNLPSVSADPKLVRIIFQNLLSNAVKYTAPGGTVKLSITLTPPNLLITVADTGYGIPAVVQDKIFTKLFRADNIRDKEAEGTGLGLYIVKSIVDASGGRIEFDSLEGKGTTFRVLMPLSGMPKKVGARGLT